MKYKIINIYLFFIQKQLHIPINRYVYYLHYKAIEYYKIKKQYISNYILLSSLKKKKIYNCLLEDFNSFRSIFINGAFSYSYSSIISIILLSKSFYLKKSALKVDVSYKRFIFKEIFSFFQEGIYFYIPSGMFIKTPIEILYLFTEIDLKWSIRNLIILGRGSCIKVFEHYKNLYSNKKKDKILAIIYDIYMCAYSYLDFCKIKYNIYSNYIIDHTYILQEYRSECNIKTLSFCGKSISIMTFLFLSQLGKEILSSTNHLNIFKNKNYNNHNYLIEHIFPNGKSKDFYKGIFNRMAKASFKGKIIVLNTAQKTFSIQKNYNILFSRGIRVSVNPKLEIFAKNVKCSHGCIIGYLNSNEIFYFLCKGIPLSEVKTYLVIAFTRQILKCLSFYKLKNSIYNYLYKDVIWIRNS